MSWRKLLTARLPRHVFDTNILVSAVIKPRSNPAAALRKALRSGLLLYCKDTRQERKEVLLRPRFERYRPHTLRERYLRSLLEISKRIDQVPALQACRDPRDDKFLALAVAGHADCIITGDKDLLALHPFRGIAILTPMAYLER